MKTKTRKVHPEISRETWEEQSAAGRYNAATIATFKGKRFSLSAGRSDYTVFWSDPDAKRLYCLSVNSGLGYVGLESFDTSPLTREETHEESADSPTGERRRETPLARTACASVFYQNAFEELERDDMESDPCDLPDAVLFGLCRDYCDICEA